MSKKQPVLLAKGIKDPAGQPLFEETLWGHTSRVMECFEIMFGSRDAGPTALSETWMRFFRLPFSLTETFLLNSKVSCGLHDPGKCPDFFQNMLLGRDYIKVIEHEHLSGLFLWLPEVRSWLETVPLLNPFVLFSAVAGHHIRCRRENFAQPLSQDAKSFNLDLQGTAALFKRVGDALGFPFSPEDGAFVSSRWDFTGRGGFDPCELRDDIAKKMMRFSRGLKKDPLLSRLLAAVRGALILADSSGSGLAREKKDIREWLETAFGEKLSDSYVVTNIIAPRVEEIREKRGCFEWGDFQVESEKLGERALLLAPCGSGKTLAAWRWIKARLGERPAGRVIFLYPTRATATEGFRDYVSWAPEADASLLHGTSDYELDGMFPDEDERSSKNFTAEERLYALGFWHRRVFSATVDQFLAFMQQVYRSTCLLPVLADSVVVVDEVHSFDPCMFSALKLFLQNFDVPVLCMTASLPPSRRQALVDDCRLDVFPKSMDAFPKLRSGAEMVRYRVHRLTDEDQAAGVALDARAEGKRVLWVVNNVSRCQRLAQDLGAICYHSRFRLEDRNRRHREVIAAFQEEGEGVVAVTTQVCEMSLDLDADLLISEIAPVTSMIQRMGRCNRHAQPGSGKLGYVYFYSPEDELPYEPVDLAGASDFVDALAGREAGQVELERLLEQLAPGVFEPDRYSAFLDDGPWAWPRELRGTEEFSLTAILSGDLSRYFELKRLKKSVDGLYLPVPRRFAERHPRLGSFPRVADSLHYRSRFGFLDTPPPEIIGGSEDPGWLSDEED